MLHSLLVLWFDQLAEVPFLFLARLCTCRVNSRDKVVLTSTNDLCALFFVSGNTFLERSTSLHPRVYRRLPGRGKNSLARKFYLLLANAFILSRKHALTASVFQPLAKPRDKERNESDKSDDFLALHYYANLDFVEFYFPCFVLSLSLSLMIPGTGVLFFFSARIISLYSFKFTF